MTNQTGLGDNLYVAGYDLSGDIQMFDKIGGGPSLIDMTDITQEAYDRQGGNRSGQIDAAAYFNKATGRAHPRFSALPTTDQIVSYFRGTAIGNAAANVVGMQIGYDGSRDKEGNLIFKVSALSNAYGLEWGEQLTAGKRTDTGATNGSSFDAGAASANGLQAYLHVFSFTGTDVTIKLQESSDDGSTDAFADVTDGAFTQVTSGPTSERIATANDQAVEEYLRVITTTSGGFSSLVFAVVVVRNETAVVF